MLRRRECQRRTGVGGDQSWLSVYFDYRVSVIVHVNHSWLVRVSLSARMKKLTALLELESAPPSKPKPSRESVEPPKFSAADATSIWEKRQRQCLLFPSLPLG